MSITLEDFTITDAAYIPLQITSDAFFRCSPVPYGEADFSTPVSPDQDKIIVKAK